jgi:hypothetical protein
MLDFTPECMNKRFDLKLKVDLRFIEKIISVDSENREAVALNLRLGHAEIQIDILINQTDTVAVIADFEILKQLLVQFSLIADETALHDNADQIA